MSVKHRLRTIFVCLALECGALIGAPMRIEELRELLRSLSAPKLARTTPEERHADAKGPDAVKLTV